MNKLLVCEAGRADITSLSVGKRERGEEGEGEEGPD